MYYILYASEDQENVLQEIIPLLDGHATEQIMYPLQENFTLKREDVILPYLKESDLKAFLPNAAEKDWPVTILPHPDVKFSIKGLGIASEPKQAITELLGSTEERKLDLLCCNGQPVFQSVNIGEVFLLTQEEPGKQSFFKEMLRLFKNIRRISGLSHHSFELSIEGEKIIHTSALGIVVVEHALSSIVSKRLVNSSSMNDGMFHVLIMAPESVFSLLVFLLRSLVPRTSTFRTLPSFIGQIKTGNLCISGQSSIEYTIDGEKTSAENIQLKVHPKQLKLRQKSIHSKENEAEAGKKSLKIDQLPTGEKREALIKRKLPTFPRATTEEFQDLFKVLRENAETTWPFMVMLVLSTLIATFGLYSNSSPVIIGAMILAPIIAPIVSFSMGMVRYDINMLKKGILTILAGTAISLVFSAGVSLLIPLRIVTSEIEARLSPSLLDLGIAIASGIAAAYAHAKEGIAKSLAGVAIAVALVPPLAVAGIGIGWWDWDLFSGAFLLYLTNLAGIIMFSGITFLLLGFAPFKRAKMGLVYTFIIVLIVVIPLSFSFNKIMQEADVTRTLEGSTYENVVLRDVKVHFGKPMKVSVKLVGPEVIPPEKINKIKQQIEDRLKYPIVLEVISAVEY